MYKSILAAAALLIATGAANAALVISEVDAAGSGTSTYSADWFELTNTGPLAVDLTGWKMDDGSAAFATAVPIANITFIQPGQSVIFIETGNLPSKSASFTTAWFGSNPPAGLTFASYNGSGVGLSTGSDGVALFDAAGVLQTSVSFGASPAGATLDNAAGLTGTISTGSVAGVNGAFLSADGAETGSPGTIANAVPEPTILFGAAPLAALVRRRRA